jgi:hypothetical protein
MSGEVTHRIVCAVCHIPVERRIDVGGSKMVACLRCGQTDTLENAIRDAVQHAFHQSMRESATRLGLGKGGFEEPPRRTFPS